MFVWVVSELRALSMLSEREGVTSMLALLQ